MAFNSQLPFANDISGTNRTSSKLVLGDYKFLKDNLPLLFGTAGTGTVAYSAPNRLQLSVTAGQFVIAQSKQYHPYVSGNSQLCQFTFDNFQTEANTTKEIGYLSSSIVSPFTANLDGFRLYNDGTDVRFQVIKDGTIVIDKAQSQWQNTLPGYNWQNFTVAAVDFLYLGGAGIRLWIYVNGFYIPVLSETYAGSAQGTFMNFPNKPLRFSVRSTTGTATMNVFCAKVATEGGFGLLGIGQSVDNGATGFTAATIGTTYAVKGIRKKANNLDTYIRAESSLVFVNSADQVRVNLYLNPTVAGVFTYTDVANSGIQEASGAATNTISGGTKIEGSYNAQNGLYTIGKENALATLGSTLTGVSDTIVLGVTPLSANVTILGLINYKEII